MTQRELESTEGWTCCAVTTIGTNEDPHQRADAALKRYAKAGNEYGYQLQRTDESGVFHITAVLSKRPRT